MKKGDHHKYGEGVSVNVTPESFDDRGCCKGSPGFRTDYSQTMQPNRGPRTYPSVEVISGRTMEEVSMVAKSNQSKASRMDESLGERRGKESTKKQSYKSRRDESKGAKKRKNK